MSKRFTVQRPPNVKDGLTEHEVGADEMRTNGGALEFWIGGELNVAYGPGFWVNAWFEYDEGEPDD
ncbi:hypothetical protein MUN76_15260 [Leucobacter rhizosphaerae]|uniref:Lasso RiPP family leader peptide-containing protein n=1 Tax=Leucobacter rhizosphaerae TaxID=2932245 RepID=A0ABY4FVP7_9MICO|nr:hypothetical protein [Leucobacter rhizosphaerae]UOQ60367.1 hypothetical protein MUN76_15260 [Leucobacter rhizosphaerae]